MDPSRAAREVLRPVLIDRVLAPFRDFTRIAASGGIALILATLIALLWANSPWGESYEDLWTTMLGISAGQFELEMDLHHWINDGLMVIFFFVVGLEIKREILVGELASLRRALLPILAAAGGAITPALIFLALNAGREGAGGWGIPMATDIAFSLGILALLGSRVPIALKVFLTALAIVDDIIAVLVIAVFYSDNISLSYLLAGALIIVVLVAANLLGIHHPLVYALLGVGLWYVVLESGIHATLAGVALAFTIPARTRINSRELIDRARRSLDEFESAGMPSSSILSTYQHQASVAQLEVLAEHAQSPIQRLEHTLHGWVAFAIIPIFALANAGVSLSDSGSDALSSWVAYGIALALILGNQIGITVFSFVAVKLGLTELPRGIGWREIYAVSWLGGVGFTMSLFIAGLAYTDSTLLGISKIGILAGSIIAGAIGYLLLRVALGNRRTAPAD